MLRTKPSKQQKIDDIQKEIIKNWSKKCEESYKEPQIPAMLIGFTILTEEENNVLHLACMAEEEQEEQEAYEKNNTFNIGQVKIVSALIKYAEKHGLLDSIIQQKNKDGFTPAYLFAKYCKFPHIDNHSVDIFYSPLAIFTKLIKGLDINFQYKKNSGKSLLHLCCENNLYPFVKHLVRNNKTRIDLISDEDKTPLDYAVQSKSLDIVNLLLTEYAARKIYIKNINELIQDLENEKNEPQDFINKKIIEELKSYEFKVEYTHKNYAWAQERVSAVQSFVPFWSSKPSENKEKFEIDFNMVHHGLKQRLNLVKTEQNVICAALTFIITSVDPIESEAIKLVMADNDKRFNIKKEHITVYLNISKDLTLDKSNVFISEEPVSASKHISAADIAKDANKFKENIINRLGLACVPSKYLLTIEQYEFNNKNKKVAENLTKPLNLNAIEELFKRNAYKLPFFHSEQALLAALSEPALVKSILNELKNKLGITGNEKFHPEIDKEEFDEFCVNHYGYKIDNSKPKREMQGVILHIASKNPPCGNCAASLIGMQNETINSNSKNKNFIQLLIEEAKDTFHIIRPERLRVPIFYSTMGSWKLPKIEQKDHSYRKIDFRSIVASQKLYLNTLPNGPGAGNVHFFHSNNEAAKKNNESDDKYNSLIKENKLLSEDFNNLKRKYAALEKDNENLRKKIKLTESTAEMSDDSVIAEQKQNTM